MALCDRVMTFYAHLGAAARDGFSLGWVGNAGTFSRRRRSPALTSRPAHTVSVARRLAGTFDALGGAHQSRGLRIPHAGNGPCCGALTAANGYKA